MIQPKNDQHKAFKDLAPIMHIYTCVFPLIQDLSLLADKNQPTGDRKVMEDSGFKANIDLIRKSNPHHQHHYASPH